MLLLLSTQLIQEKPYVPLLPQMQLNPSRQTFRR